MSKKDKEEYTPAARHSGFAAPESQSERVVKYGANVALTSVVVLLLAGIAVWGAEKFHKRTYLASDANVHLTPQSIKVVSELQKPIKLVGLYARLKPDAQAADQQDFFQPVADLLEEYKRNGTKVDIEMIDPVSDPAKLDVWLAHVIEKYGGDVAGYRKFLNEFPAAFKDVRAGATGEVQRMQQMVVSLGNQGSGKPPANSKDEQLSPEEVMQAFQRASQMFKNPRQFRNLSQAVLVVFQINAGLDEIDHQIKPELEKKLPNYKVVVDAIEGQLTGESTILTRVVKVMEDIAGVPATNPATTAIATAPTTAPADNGVPPLAREYARKSIPRFLAMKKAADDQLAKIHALGELKLDKVREKLTSVDETDSASTRTIAVEGPDDIRVIAFKDAWRVGGGAGLRKSAAPIRYRFAGEQQVTTSILSLTTKKTKVAFVHAGGASKLTQGRDQQSGAMSEIADRLRSYNFEVVEKDIAPSPMGGMMGQPPEQPASLEDVKDAVWVVFDEPNINPQFGPMPRDPSVAEKVRQHLDGGGSVLALFQGDLGAPMASPIALASLLAEYGLDPRGNLIAVHEKIGEADEEAEDFIERARRSPPIFVLNDFGDHVVTASIDGLDAALVPLQPVELTHNTPPDTKITRILPVPTDPKSWGESDVDSIRKDDITFDPKGADLSPPVFGGAIVERKGKGRLILIGNAEFVSNGLLDMPDPRIRREQELVIRFPGNGELFTNSIFWLAHQDSMIALSPASMDTPRVAKMGDLTLNFWRYGVVVAGLPLAAILSGLFVWQKRRE